MPPLSWACGSTQGPGCWSRGGVWSPRGQEQAAALSRQHSQSCLQSQSPLFPALPSNPRAARIKPARILNHSYYTSLLSFCLLELFTTGVKALQKQLAATVFMKAGISEPALIRFNTVLPVCLSVEMIFQGGFEELDMRTIQLSPGEAGNHREKPPACNGTWKGTTTSLSWWLVHQARSQAFPSGQQDAGMCTSQGQP